jgi:tetratricopeptide (TPR) repeat protein
LFGQNVVSDKQELFQSEYQQGKYAFERGQYRLGVQHLEKACQLVAPNSRLGGEAQMWLVTAYQAANQLQEAISLCKQLTQHPNLEIRKQSKRLLYIIEAPKLQRPREWMTEIPDLSKASESNGQYLRGSGTVKKNVSPVIEPIDLSQVNTKDNKFIWVALILILLLLGGAIWLG